MALSIMSGFSAPWYVAGGWALDLFLNRVRRQHYDLDIVVFRRDQVELHEHLSQDWPLLKVTEDSEGHHRVPWTRGEWLELPVFQVVLKVNEEDGTNAIEVLLSESEGDQWFHRDFSNVRRSLSSVGLKSATDVPYFAPEIVLFYKSKPVPPQGRINGEKDQADFAEIQPYLNAEQRAWLHRALQSRYGDHHHWLDKLQALHA